MIHQARSVLATVEAAAQERRWSESPIADRAHSPFVAMLDDVGQNLRCICILGQDEFLVCPGSAYAPGPAFVYPDAAFLAERKAEDDPARMADEGKVIGYRPIHERLGRLFS